MRLVLITWYDSHHRPGWTRDPPPTEPQICQSVGWISYESRSVTVLTSNLTKEESVQRLSDMAIPTGAIISTQEVGVMDERKPEMCIVETNAPDHIRCQNYCGLRQCKLGRSHTCDHVFDL